MSQSSLMGKPTSEANHEFRHRIIELPEKNWEKLWLWTSERINPIVVKEIRQSLKSKQFTVSFGLTLIAAVSWTLIAITLMVPRIYYVPAGLPLLTGFFCILTLPLMVIIPFSAFRSLTAETEDSTFELLSISALSALQIVHGKMASACVQIVLYLSALAPCIVLTYLLRGVSLFSILFLLGLTVAFSISETALALMFASVARTRMAQTGISVLVLAGLLIGFFGWLSLLISEGFNEFSNPPREIYLVLFALLTIVAIAISLVLRASAAAIDFPSENHSTPLRLRILGLLTLSLFWILFAIVASQEGEIAVVFVVGVFVVSMLIGSLITGERGIISPRAQRTLPKTFLGRVFLTWLYPGAGLGYVFLVCMFAALVATLIAVEIYYSYTMRNLFGNDSVMAAGYLLLCYLAFYLGVNRLVMMLVPRQLPGRMIGSVAMLAVILILSHMIPLFTAYYLNDYREFDYAWHQAFNIVWSTSEAIDQVSLDIGASLVILTLCAIGVFGLNLVLCTRDVMLVRVALPPRVREEDGSNEPKKADSTDPFAD
jgi:hypothetical protein